MGSPYLNLKLNYYTSSYDVYNSSYPIRSQYDTADLNGASLIIEAVNSTVQVERITIFIDDLPIKVLYFTQKGIFFSDDFVTFSSLDTGIAKSGTLTLGTDGVFDESDKTRSVSTVSSNVFTSYYGVSFNITANVSFKYTTASSGRYYEANNVIFNLGTVRFYLPTIKKLSLNTKNIRTSYYVGAYLDPLDKLKVIGHYNYYLDDTIECYTTTITNFTADYYDYATEDENGWYVRTYNNYGYISIKYSNVSTPFKYQIFSYSLYNTPKILSPRNDNNFRIGEECLTQRILIQYNGIADGYTSQSEYINAEITGFDTNSVGERVATIKVAPTRTPKKITTITATYKVYDIYNVIIDASNVQKNFDFDEEFNHNNLVVKANYGNGQEGTVAGSENITDYNIALPIWSVGSNKFVQINYRNFQSGYYININGLYSVELDYSNNIYYDTLTNGLRFLNSKTLDLTVNTVFARYYENGILSSNKQFSGTITYPTNQDYALGYNNVQISFAENGVSINKTIEVIKYDFTSLALENVPTTYFAGDEFQIDNLLVKADTTDNRVEILTANQYTITPGLGTILTAGLKNIVITSVDNPNVSKQFTINVLTNQIDPNSEIIVAGSIKNKYVKINNQVDVSGLSVSCYMLNGDLINNVSFTATIANHSGLSFNDDDILGSSYDIIIKVNGVNNSYTIKDAVIFDGVKDIRNVKTNKTTYEVGEYFDPNSILYDVEEYNGTILTAQSGNITDYQAEEFSYSQAGNISFSFKIYSKAHTVNLFIKKITSLNITNANSNPKTKYKIFEAFNTNDYIFTFKYNDNSERNLTSSEISDLNITFYDSDNQEITDCLLTSLKPSRDRNNEKVIVYFTYNYANNINITSNIQIDVIALKTITLYNATAEQITKLSFEENTNFNLDGCVLNVVFNNGENTVLAIDNSMTISPGLNSILTSHNQIQGSITYMYVLGDSLTYNFTIHIHYLDQITVNFTGVQDSYFVNDILDLSAVSGTSKIVSTDTSENEYPKTNDISNDLDFVFGNTNISHEYALNQAGSFILVASYCGLSQSKTISVNSISLTSLECIKASNFKELNSYVDTQQLTLAGLSIKLNYNNGTSTTIPYTSSDVSIVDEDGDIFSKTTVLNKLIHNGKNLYVVYQEKSVLLGTLQIADKILSSIVINNEPSKKNFTYGDKFNANNISVIAYFNDGSSDYALPTNITYSPYNIGYVFNKENDTTFGQKTITVSYQVGSITKTATYNIELSKPSLASITTNYESDAFKKSYINGDLFSLEGLVVKANYANGYQETITNYTTNAQIVLSLQENIISLAPNNYGSKNITITVVNPYETTDILTTDIIITVATNGAVQSAILQFDENIDYINYFVGETYDARGVYFLVTDIDGNTFQERNFLSSLTKGTTLRSAQKIEIRLTYTKGSFATTQSYTISVNIKYQTSYTETKDYKIAFGLIDGTLIKQIKHKDNTIELGEIYDESGTNIITKYYPIFEANLVQIDNNNTHANTYGLNIYVGSNADEDCIGYVDLGLNDEYGNIIRNAHIIFFEDTDNPIEGNGNIVVQFPHYVAGNADKINKSHFGIVYNNRLFVSGNSEFKNMDFHSSAVNVSQVDNYDNNIKYDYTYFSDLDYCSYGTDETAIVGYDIYRDGDLIVVKESSKNQATLYRRSYQLINATNYAGTVISENGELVEDVFPMFDINLNGGEGGLNSRTIVNFVGETLILTKNGLKAVVAKDGVYASLKYLYDVSTYINPRIVNEDLSNAFIFVFKEKLYLKTNRGLYIGYNELRNTNSEYEWYFVDGVDANMFFEYHNELYFANDNGSIYRFPNMNATYLDKNRYALPIGSTLFLEGTSYASLSESDNTIIVSKNYADLIENGRKFYLIADDSEYKDPSFSLIHYAIGNFVHENTIKNNPASVDFASIQGVIKSDNTFEIKCFNSDGSVNEIETTKALTNFIDNAVVYVDNVDNNVSNLAVHLPYKLKLSISENGLNYSYCLIDENEQIAEISTNSQMRLSRLIDSQTKAYICNTEPYNDNGAKIFKLENGLGVIYDIIAYNNELRTYSGIVSIENNVVAEYITAPFNLGTSVILKTIWLWTIINDTSLASEIEIGYIASRSQADYLLATKASRQLNFDAPFAFERVQFLNDQLPHLYTKYKTLANVLFMRFKFKNENPTNMVLTAIEIIYSLSQYSKGVK